MPLPGLSPKQLCLWGLLWSELLLSSLCDDEPLGKTKTELLVVGTPLTPTSLLTSTITITTTVAYEPSSSPGESQYTFAGCYSQPSGDGRHIFGADSYVARVPPEEFTIDGCLRSCGSAALSSDGAEHFVYAGLRNGSECLCGIRLSPDAHKLSTDNCMRPCLGDPNLSCGGQEDFAIYDLTSGDRIQKHGSQSGSNSGGTGKGGSPTSPSTADSLSKVVVFQTKAPTSSTAPKASDPKPAIAAVAGSLSGAVLAAACLFLCYRANKRRKRAPDAPVRSVLERRGRPSIPSLVLIGSHVPRNAKRKSGDDEDGGSSGTDDYGKGSRLTPDSDLIPSTPTIEYGAALPAGLHARTAASVAATGPGLRTAALERDSPRATPTGENPVTHSHAAGASSAVQWRPGVFASPGILPPSPNLPPPPPATPTDGRAWHRRKPSATPRHPPAAGLGTGAAAGAAVGLGRRNIAQRGPAGGPPMSLPPTPPARPGVPGRPRIAKAGTGTGEVFAPTPRRSSDTRALASQLAAAGGDARDAPPSAVDGVVVRGGGGGKGSDRSLSHSRNVSTPSLGRYGSLSRPNRANAESPVLGWRAPNARGRLSAPAREAGRDAPADAQPVLPPIAPGERFDHRRWRGTIYAQPYENRHVGDEGSPTSASSTGTSILFGSEEFDRRL
ncbi:hypothetical protein F4802DRAFT_511168 [Xylaria palmicola]|nr:hypothetical protein F4802DRAFT_511168 [Xylaria palmicola]